MADLISYGSRFSPQGVDHSRNHSQRKQDELNRYQASAKKLGVIAVLIATVTFAAAFTLPGGYKNDSESDEGLAILSSKASFKAFLISDTIAMVSSITAVLVLIFYSGSLDRHVQLTSWMGTMQLVYIALFGMSVAFITGVYSVIERHSKWVVVLVALIACSVPYFTYLVLSYYSAYYLVMDLGPEELIRHAKRKSNFMDDTTRGQAKSESKHMDFIIRSIQFYL